MGVKETKGTVLGQKWLDLNQDCNSWKQGFEELYNIAFKGISEMCTNMSQCSCKSINTYVILTTMLTSLKQAKDKKEYLFYADKQLFIACAT